MIFFIIAFFFKAEGLINFVPLVENSFSIYILLLLVTVKMPNTQNLHIAFNTFQSFF